LNKRKRERDKQEKTRAAAAPRKPKKGAVSSPLKPAMVRFNSSATMMKLSLFVLCGRNRRLMKLIGFVEIRSKWNVEMNFGRKKLFFGLVQVETDSGLIAKDRVI